MEEKKLYTTPQSKENLKISKILYDTDNKKKKNKDFIKDIKDTKLRSIEIFTDEINNIETKLKPIEDEYKLNTFQNYLKISFDSKYLCFNVTNVFFSFLIIFVFSLNVYVFYQKYKGSIIPRDFESPIISILPEDLSKGKLEFE